MKNYKKAMVLAEFVVAIFICGVLLTLSIHMFRANDMTKVPYIYSFLKQIPEANALVIKECNYSGGCIDKGALPDSRLEYCLLLTESLGTSGDVNCVEGVKEEHKGTDGAAPVTLYKNFTLINGISVYNLSYTGADSWQGANPKYIDAFIGVKVRKSKEGAAAAAPRKGKGTIGENIFPVRIFKNGEIIPSYYEDFDTFNDEEFFAYKIVLNKLKDGSTTLRENITLSFKPDDTVTEEGSDSQRLTKTSFKDAVCRANGENEFKYYFSELAASDTSCGSVKLLDECDSTKNADKTAYCTVEYIKPQATGIFKFFGI